MCAASALMVGLVAGNTEATEARPTAGPLVEPSESLEDAGRVAMELVEAKSADYTGAEIRGADNQLTIALPAGAGLARREAYARNYLHRRGIDPDITVRFTVAAVSQAGLERQKAKLLAGLDKAVSGSVTGVGEDVIAGELVIYLDQESATTQRTIVAKVGGNVRFGVLPRGDLDIRSLDPAPHWGAAGYRIWDVAHRENHGVCSAGFAVTVGSSRYLWTAGHCMPGATPWPRAWAQDHFGTTPEYYFGTKYTTTWSGTPDDLRDNTQDVYGDWSLLAGSSYNPRVYSDTLSSNVSAPVGAASYTALAVGSQVCTSGATSAKTCRLFVTISDFTLNHVDGRIARQTVVRSNQDLGGPTDCAGPRPGDSGGSVFQGISSRPGYVRAMGQHTYGHRDFPNNDCWYTFTRLDGLRAWNSGASVVLAP